LSVLGTAWQLKQGLLEVDCPCAHVEWSVRATGGTWLGGVVATAIGTCESAWHFKHSPEVSVAVVNFKSLTATCNGAMGGLRMARGAIDPSRTGRSGVTAGAGDRAGRCTAGAPSAWTSVWVMGNNG